VADTVYNAYKAGLLNADINHANGGDTIKLALLDNTHTIDQDTHDFFDDVSADEMTGTNYVAGGATLANQAVTQDNTDNEGVFDADNVTWSSSTITNARFAVLYKSTGTASTSPLMCIWDFGTDKSSSNGDFTVAFDTEGIINIT
jgi:hypothetical protein